MKELTADQQKTVDILELAGYHIKTDERTFSLWEGETKLTGYSSYTFLRPSFMMREIKSHAHKKGYKKGRESLRQELALLLFGDK